MGLADEHLVPLVDEGPGARAFRLLDGSTGLGAR
jgi:hypothetical protein